MKIITFICLSLIQSFAVGSVIHHSLVNSYSEATAHYSPSKDTFEVGRWVTYHDGGADNDETPDIGDGSDGPFNRRTWTSIASRIEGNTIYLDSSQTYQFTSFDLPVGFTLRCEGNFPLIIKTTLHTNIAGLIDLSGEAGTDADLSTTSTQIGPTGVCGGAKGGNGGASDEAGGRGGTYHTTPLTGGEGGQITFSSSFGEGAGGGGGGGHSPHVTATNGEDVFLGGLGGTAGQSYGDDYLTHQIGGAGGGGGAGYELGASPSCAGASGGAGGGVFQLTTGGNIHIRGQITADGGEGGTTADNFHCSAGGGGAGGLIWLQSYEEIHISGTVTAKGGTGGSGFFAGGGGNGASGYTRIEETRPTFTGRNQVTPLSQLTPFPQVVYNNVDIFSVTSPTHFLSAAPGSLLAFSPNELTPTSTQTSWTVELSSSPDFTTVDARFSPDSLPQSLTFSYLRLVAELSTDLITTTPQFRGYSLTWIPLHVNSAEFDQVGCLSVKRSPHNQGFPLWVLIFFFISCIGIGGGRLAYSRSNDHIEKRSDTDETHDTHCTDSYR